MARPMDDEDFVAPRTGMDWQDISTAPKDGMSAEEVMSRELEHTYNTPELRAAYRAGMSTAAAICDEVRERVEKNNPGPKKNSVGKLGKFGGHVANTCAHYIWQARDRIHVPDHIGAE